MNCIKQNDPFRHAFYEPKELVGKTRIAITNLPPGAMMGIESCGMLLFAENNLKNSEDEELLFVIAAVQENMIRFPMVNRGTYLHTEIEKNLGIV